MVVSFSFLVRMLLVLGFRMVVPCCKNKFIFLIKMLNAACSVPQVVETPSSRRLMIWEPLVHLL